MRSDMFRDYCEALTNSQQCCTYALRPSGSLVEMLTQTLHEVFASFDEEALGSASIAQAMSCASDRRRVVVKVQREGIHDLMSRDIMLLNRVPAAEICAGQRAGGSQSSFR